MQTELKFLSQLSDKSQISNIDISQLSEDLVVKLLLENQMMLPFLKNTQINDPKSNSIKNEITKILNSDYLEHFEEKLKYVLSFLKDLDVECMLHKYSFFEREQSDIDILIPVDKHELVIDKLEKEGFTPISVESYKTAMAKLDDNSKFVIHVHSKIKWESEFIPTDDVWKRSRAITICGNQIRIPNPEDAILIEAIHSIFENRIVRVCDILQLAEIISKNQIDWDQVISRLVQYKCQAAGCIYFSAVNVISASLFNKKLIAEDVIKSLRSSSSAEEKYFAITPAMELLNSSSLPPLKIKLTSSAILFLIFNGRLGPGKFFWAIGVILNAAIKHIRR